MAFNSSKVNLGRRNKLWEMWDCQLGSLTAGKVYGGGGNGLSMVELGCRVEEGKKSRDFVLGFWVFKNGGKRFITGRGDRDLAKQVPKIAP
ncbi:hypothetical protein Tco_1061085 [Tanacetum coccineum]